MTDAEKDQLQDAMVLLEMTFMNEGIIRFGFAPDFTSEALVRAAHDLIQMVYSENEGRLNDETFLVLARLKIARKIDEVRLYIPGFYDEIKKPDANIEINREDTQQIDNLWIPIKNKNTEDAIRTVNATIKEKNLQILNIETIEESMFWGFKKIPTGLRVWYYS
jgi:hypothetical protein